MLRRLLRKLRARVPLGGDPAEAPTAGDLMSVVTDAGEFGVVKILAVDEDGVHLRLFAQRYEHRPLAGDLGELRTAPFGAGHRHPFSAGHLPLRHRTFRSWQPQFITTQSVTEEELEGFRLWEEAEGGYC